MQCKIKLIRMHFALMAPQANFLTFWYGGSSKEVLIDYLSVQEYFFSFKSFPIILIGECLLSSTPKKIGLFWICTRSANIFFKCLTISKNDWVKGIFIIFLNKIVLGARTIFLMFFLANCKHPCCRAKKGLQSSNISIKF